jgi:hypothetical protein
MTIRTCVLVTAGFVAAIASDILQAQSASNVSVLRYQLVSSTRVDRTRFDYVYRIVVRNPGPAFAADAIASVSSLSSATAVIDATVKVGDVAPLAEASSTDTFTIRQDRLIAFNPSNLKWNVLAFPVSGAVLPPDPGTAGEVSLQGVDQNGNDVRDDLERFILTRYASPPSRNALFEYARLFQDALETTTADAAMEVRKRQILNHLCLTAVAGSSAQSLSDSVLAHALNTLPRARRFFEFDALSGGMYALPPAGAPSSHCPTGPF